VTPLDVVVCGLTISSSWGNGHATTYRSLLRELAARGHRVRFLERDVPWYADSRDEPSPEGVELLLYPGLGELRDAHTELVADADVVIVGSYVPDGVEVAEWVLETAQGVVAFYDIDTPVTVSRLDRGDREYLSPELVSRFDLYLSFSGGPVLRRLEDGYGARRAVALYCSVDPGAYAPRPDAQEGLLGYLGTYSADRQPALERLLLAPARALSAERFTVAGPLYPEAIDWPANVRRVEHVEPARHAAFYAASRYTLNVTRADMRRAGWSPSVRLFEAAACGAPIISDSWRGLEELFTPGREILLADDTTEALRHLTGTSEEERIAIAARARARVLAEHTAARRAEQLEEQLARTLGDRRTAAR